MSQAPAELWLVQTAHDKPRWIVPNGRITPAPDAVRYVRADLFADLLNHYEALQARLEVVRSWGEAPCLEPLKPVGGADYPR